MATARSSTELSAPRISRSARNKSSSALPRVCPSAHGSAMLTGPEAGPPRSKAGRRIHGLLLFAALICGALVAPFVAIAQNTVTIDTAVLGMTGWRTGPARTPIVETAALGMTGWRTDPVVVNTHVLGMTGWRTVEPRGARRHSRSARSKRHRVPAPRRGRPQHQDQRGRSGCLQPRVHRRPQMVAGCDSAPDGAEHLHRRRRAAVRDRAQRAGHLRAEEPAGADTQDHCTGRPPL